MQKCLVPGSRSVSGIGGIGPIVSKEPAMNTDNSMPASLSNATKNLLSTFVSPPAPAIGGPRLLVDTHEAAAMLSVSERTLWGLTMPRGPLPCVRPGSGRMVRYAIEDLEGFVHAGRTKAL